MCFGFVKQNLFRINDPLSGLNGVSQVAKDKPGECWFRQERKSPLLILGSDTVC